ncbi:hypothetical protein A1351_06480 [Methylosinus sp. R-45379]|uniref:hypothetical protein n=1 Tax=unclassified Methylosinus TaxID=2624500 RepID=UPI0004642669|nr:MULTISPECIES: hypothetical protein [unclassified Methylosinus]OAI31122.1 hypothetical protein A1351_06480 [Methylosinus sp. R-45379]TDX61163.1 hypothetical protein EDE12_11639 [Methylosinus sp. sav-2]
MGEFKIKVARIEAAAPNEKGDRVQITFEVEREPLVFQIPILLEMKEFDDTEMVQVAKNELHRTFDELTNQTEKWTLSVEDVQQLSNISLRPKT